MNKKIFATFLTLALLFCACAQAETTVRLNENSDNFDITLSVPNGMAVTQEALTLGVSGQIEVSGMPDLKIVFALAPDDSYSNMALEDLTPDDVESIFGLMVEDMGEGVYETTLNSQGMMLLTMSDDRRTEYITLALYNGYFFYMEAYHKDFTPLSDDEIAQASSLADTLAVTDAAAN